MPIQSNAGVNPTQRYNDPLEVYDVVTNSIANAHAIVTVALTGLANGSFSGTATAIQSGTDLTPGTIGGTPISSAFLKLANAASTTVSGGLTITGGTFYAATGINLTSNINWNGTNNLNMSNPQEGGIFGQISVNGTVAGNTPGTNMNELLILDGLNSGCNSSANAFSIEHVAFSGFSGGRTTFNAAFSMFGPSINSQVPGNNGEYGPCTFYSGASCNDGGTFASPRSTLFGGNNGVSLGNGATFWGAAVAWEMDFAVNLGANALCNYGFNLATGNDHQVNGWGDDVGILISGGLPGVPNTAQWETVIGIGANFKAPPSNNKTTFLKCFTGGSIGLTTMVANTGIDFSVCTFTSNVINVPGLQVPGQGLGSTKITNGLAVTGNTSINAGTLTVNSIVVYDSITGNSANAHQIVLAAYGAATGNYSGTATSIGSGVALDPGTVGGISIANAFVHAGGSIANATYANTAGTVASITSTQVTSALGYTPVASLTNATLTNPTILANATILGNASIAGNTTMNGALVVNGVVSLTGLSVPTAAMYVTSAQGTIAGFTTGANTVNYIEYQGAAFGQPVSVVATGETSGGMTIGSGSGQLQLNNYNGQDVLIGTQHMSANASQGFPCIPSITGVPTGSPGGTDGTVSAGWQSPIITSNNGGTYALYAWVNYGWHSVQLGGSYITSAALPATSGLYGGSGSAGQASAITIGSNLTLSGGTLSASGTGGSSNPTVHIVNSSNSYSYTGTTSTYIKWTSNAASIKYQTIPTANAALSGVSIVIKDGYGNAGTAGNAIIITPLSNTCTIDGQSSLTIATNYGFAQLFCDGSTSDWSTF